MAGDLNMGEAQGAPAAPRRARRLPRFFLYLLAPPLYLLALVLTVIFHLTATEEQLARLAELEEERANHGRPC